MSTAVSNSTRGLEAATSSARKGRSDKNRSKERKSTESGKSSRSGRPSTSGRSARSGRQAKGAIGRSSKGHKTSKGTTSKSSSLSIEFQRSSKKNRSIQSQRSQEKAKSDVIRITAGRKKKVFEVDRKAFAACSDLMKNEMAAGTLPDNIDLTKYEESTARVLFEFITVKKVKTDISFYALAELLKISKVFEMRELRAQLEKFLVSVSKSGAHGLAQSLLIIGLSPLTADNEKKVMAEAAEKFLPLAGDSSFQQLPFHLMVSLFARCDLAVCPWGEVAVVDAMLLWLAGQPSLTIYVPALFYLVRTPFLHKVQRDFIKERARALRFPEEALAAIVRSFECGNTSRVCTSHKFARCGSPPRLEAKTPDMPLSVPRKGIMYKSSTAPTATANDGRTFHSSEARPFFHAPPACADKKGIKTKAKGNKKSSRSLRQAKEKSGRQAKKSRR